MNPNATGEFRARQNYTDAERNAMRAFLQRCEVRISTQHRIATGFLGGAGLLLLIPIFFRDVVDGILIIVLNTVGNYFSSLGATNGWLMSVILFALLMYLFALSLAIPLYGVYLLLKDLVQFYYSLYTPGLPETVLNPSFSLTGVMFSIDESVNVKRDVILYQYQDHRSRYMMPFSEGKRGLYFDTILDQTEEAIIPRYRSLDNLKQIYALRADIDETHARRMGGGVRYRAQHRPHAGGRSGRDRDVDRAQQYLPAALAAALCQDSGDVLVDNVVVVFDAALLKRCPLPHPVGVGRGLSGVVGWRRAGCQYAYSVDLSSPYQR